MNRDDKFSATAVNIRPLAETLDNPYRICNFCNKLVTPRDFSVLEKLSGPSRFFCDFCLRHRHNTREGKNVFLFSFRGVIAHLYYELYLAAKLVSFSEIEDLVESHAATGLLNPVFSYDPDTLFWFVDFGRVGATKKKLPVEAVKDTISAIVKDLRLPSFLPNVQCCAKLELKFTRAVERFYHRRERPSSRRVLTPTLKGCGIPQPRQNWDRYKDFTRTNLAIRLH